MTVRIGTSGWSYDHWVGVLYPPALPKSRRLDAYTAEFDTVELNASFYRWPKPTTFAQWRQRLPAGFAMAVKAPRGLTHARRLHEPEQWIERMAAGLIELGDRRAALLVQLHPAQQRDDERLDHFLSAMPTDIPVAMELRHPTWDGHIREWDAQGRDVLVYFNNDLGGHAVRNARDLRAMIG
ncbi:DUF72 domain-containing protein [Mycobacterium adipatum]|uniref:DUF72 domain-containing protein n=1 Tax=Mycobacterium adipatum TaxID=1682113 RepID=UPI0034E0CE9B